MPPKKKAANGYQFAEPLKKGTVLEDLAKKRWILGEAIGKGGFGAIYCAKEEMSKAGNTYPYVVKVEPHSNGPLFVEINFYIRHSKPSDIESFMKRKGLKTFGMPTYYGSGSYDHNGEKYRFLVIDKFSSDLHKLFTENGRKFPTDTVFKIGIQLVDILEYIHEKGCVHADIKPANILLGASKDTQNKQVFLVDFGLVSKFSTEKTFKPNPKKAHDGTIDFLSRDAHQGVQTRRGDLEILAYNLIELLGGKLPWVNCLQDPKQVQKLKEDNMATVSKMLKASFGSGSHPKALEDYLKYLQSLDFDTAPDYDKIRSIFSAGVKEGGGTLGAPFQFSATAKQKKLKVPAKDNEEGKTSSRTRAGKRKLDEKAADPQEEDGEQNGIDEGNDGKPVAKRTGKKPQAAKKLSKIEEDPLGNVTKRKKAPIVTNLNKRKSMSLAALDDMDGYNDEMKEVAKKKVAKGRRKRTASQTRAEDSEVDEMNGFTAEMRAIALKKKARQKNNKK